MNFIFNFLFFLSIVCFSNIFSSVDFYDSYSRYGRSKETLDESLLNDDFKYKYEILKKLYDSNIDKAKKTYGDIPKIIHQIWIGNKIPSTLLPLVEKWKNLKNFEYRLWSDKDILELNFENKDLYIQASNYGQKADVARLAILEKFGGLYIDTDYEYINDKKIESFLENYDFIIGIEPIEINQGFGNAFIAASVNHPLIKKLNSSLRDNFFHFSDTIKKTGPAFVSKIIFENIDLLNGAILLPPTYIYPIAFYDEEYEEFYKDKSSFLKEETLGIHYWTMMWNFSKKKYHLHKKDESK